MAAPRVQENPRQRHPYSNNELNSAKRQLAGALLQVRPCSRIGKFVPIFSMPRMPIPGTARTFTFTDANVHQSRPTHGGRGAAVPGDVDSAAQVPASTSSATRRSRNHCSNASATAAGTPSRSWNRHTRASRIWATNLPDPGARPNLK